MKTLYALAIACLIFCVVNTSKANELCFEWTPYAQGGVGSEYGRIMQGPATAGDSTPPVIYIDNIPPLATRVCKEVAEGDESSHLYWIVAVSGIDTISEAKAENVKYYKFGSRPEGYHGFIIVPIKVAADNQ